MFTISVEYTLTPEKGFIDDDLCKIAGKQSCSSGCFLPTKARDIQWRFETKKQADAFCTAMENLKAQNQINSVEITKE